MNNPDRFDIDVGYSDPLDPYDPLDIGQDRPTPDECDLEPLPPMATVRIDGWTYAAKDVVLVDERRAA